MCCACVCVFDGGLTIPFHHGIAKSQTGQSNLPYLVTVHYSLHLIGKLGFLDLVCSPTRSPTVGYYPLCHFN